MSAKPFDYMYLVDANIRALKKMEAFFRSDEAMTAECLLRAEEMRTAIALLEKIKDNENGQSAITAFGYIGAHLLTWWD